MLDGSFWPDSCSSFLIANTLNTVKKKIALAEKANLKLGTLKKGGSQVTEVCDKSLIYPEKLDLSISNPVFKVVEIKSEMQWKFSAAANPHFPLCQFQ